MKNIDKILALIKAQATETYEKLKRENPTYGELHEAISEARTKYTNELSKYVEKLIWIEVAQMYNDEIERMSTCEIYFYCDGQKERCTGLPTCYKNSQDGSGCRHTSDIKHAKNFRKSAASYFERENIEQLP